MAIEATSVVLCPYCDCEIFMACVFCKWSPSWLRQVRLNRKTQDVVVLKKDHTSAAKTIDGERVT